MPGSGRRARLPPRGSPWTWGGLGRRRSGWSAPSSRTMQPDRSATGPRVCREAGDELAYLRADLLGPGVVWVAVGLGHGLMDEVGDDLHLAGAHALGGHRGGGDPDAGGGVRRLWVEGDDVLVEHDAGGAGPGLGILAAHPDPLQVMQ